MVISSSISGESEYRRNLLTRSKRKLGEGVVFFPGPEIGIRPELEELGGKRGPVGLDMTSGFWSGYHLNT